MPATIHQSVHRTPSSATPHRRRLRLPVDAAPDQGTAVVYALLDRDNAPVYVGTSQSLASRLPAHRGRAWWSDVALVTWEMCTPGQERFHDESWAITTLAPRENVYAACGAAIGAAFLADLRGDLENQRRRNVPPYPRQALRQWVLAVGERAPLEGHFPTLRRHT